MVAEAHLATRVMTKAFLGDVLHENGLKMGDSVSISPQQGKTKSLELTRTHYLIKGKFGNDFEIKGSEILIPTFLNQEFCAEINLVEIFDHHWGLSQVYQMEANEKAPFVINGNICFRAYLQRGDKIQIGHNLFQLEAPKANNKNECEFIDKRVLQSEISILIEGETGTGKTTLAKKIHDASNRRGYFVHLNVASYSKNLIESELFGHVKGAFTGAIADKRGAIAQANYGTLFIDEIDSLSWEIQTKLLTFLDEQKFRAVGSEMEQKVDVRFIFASGKKLINLVKDNQMRTDFYFRIASGYRCRLPSLREDQSKILQIIEQFEIANGVTFDYQLKKLYAQKSWPGNYRQLVHHLELKKTIFQRGRIQFDHWDQDLQQIIIQEIEDELRSLEDFKKYYCEKVYHRVKNFNRACKILKITPNTLRKILNHEEMI